MKTKLICVILFLLMIFLLRIDSFAGSINTSHIGVGFAGASGPHGSSSAFGVNLGFSSTNVSHRYGARPPIARRPIARPPVYGRPTHLPAYPAYGYDRRRIVRPVYTNPYPRNVHVVVPPAYMPPPVVVRERPVVYHNPVMVTPEPKIVYHNNQPSSIIYNEPARVSGSGVSEQERKLKQRIHEVDMKMLEVEWQTKMNELDRRIDELNSSRN